MQTPKTIPAIDAHCHAFPDSLAARAISTLEAKCDWKAVGDGTVGSLAKSMAAAGICKALVCMIATRPGQEESIFAFCRQLQSERFEPLASVHPNTADAAGWIQRIAEAGLPGIKIHPFYQNCAVDDPRMAPIYAAAADNDLLVTVHCGRDIAFGADDRASPQRLGRVFKNHRRVKFMATHLGGWQNWDEVRRYLLDLPMYVECSFSLQYLPAEQAEKLIRDLGTERVLLGSDWPWAGQGRTIEMLSELGFSAAQRRAILYDNAARMLGC